MCAHGVGKIEVITWACTKGVRKCRDIYVVCVNRVWGKIEKIMWACTQGVVKGRDIYVWCVHRV